MQKSKIKSQSFNSRRFKGFTLIEILITVCIIAILSGIILTSLSDFRASSDINGSKDEILTTLQEARSLTLSSKNDSNYGVQFSVSSVTLFKGPIYTADDPSNKVHFLPQGAEISSISLTGGASGVLFSRLTGAVSASGTITIRAKAKPEKTRSITISSSGLIE